MRYSTTPRCFDCAGHCDSLQSGMAQKRRARRVLPEWSGDTEDLYDYARPPPSRAGRPAICMVRPIVVTDDWPEVVPITETELRVMESHFAEELDEIFGPRA